MPDRLTGYRVFIASPGGLDDERQRFREIIQQYNETEALYRGAQFIPVGWEQNPGGMGRAQKLINKQVRECDFFICVLHDRWGTRPAREDDDSVPYTSGTEEEFYVAMQCYEGDDPMQQLVVYFKAPDPGKLNDAGPQLQQVLDFKKKLEEERKVFYRTFDELTVFEKFLRTLLGEWLRNHEDGQHEKVQALEPAERLEPTPETEEAARSAEEAPEGEENTMIRQARELADAGKLVDAEACFARAIAQGDDFDAFNAYGGFLRRVGRLAQSEAMYERAQQLAVELDDEAGVAITMGNLGIVLQTHSDLDGARDYWIQARALFEQVGMPHRVELVGGWLAGLDTDNEAPGAAGTEGLE